MLRLHLARMSPWVDRNGNVRSPHESFLLLAPETRAVLDRQPEGFVAWQFWVLSDVGWDAPPHSKPLDVAGPEGDSAPIWCHVLGDDAAEYVEPLKPLWLSFIRWVYSYFGAPRIFVKDLFGPSASRRDIAAAVVTGLLSVPDLGLRSTKTASLYTARPPLSGLVELIRMWWPTPNGFIGGVVVDQSLGTQTDGDVATRGAVSPNDLAHVTAVFETVDSPDNLGFIVLSRDDWAITVRSLGASGFSEGKVINVVPNARPWR